MATKTISKMHEGGEPQANLLSEALEGPSTYSPEMVRIWVRWALEVRGMSPDQDDLRNIGRFGGKEVLTAKANGDSGPHLSLVFDPIKFPDELTLRAHLISNKAPVEIIDAIVLAYKKSLETREEVANATVTH